MTHRWEHIGGRWRRTTSASGLHWYQLPERVRIEILQLDAARLQTGLAIAVTMAVLTLAAICWPS